MMSGSGNHSIFESGGYSLDRPHIDGLSRTIHFLELGFPDVKRIVVVSDKEQGKPLERVGVTVIVDAARREDAPGTA